MQANLRRQNYSSFIWSFESGNCGKEGKKLQFIEKKKSFLDEIESIFYNFWNAFSS